MDIPLQILKAMLDLRSCLVLGAHNSPAAKDLRQEILAFVDQHPEDTALAPLYNDHLSEKVGQEPSKENWVKIFVDWNYSSDWWHTVHTPDVLRTAPRCIHPILSGYKSEGTVVVSELEALLAFEWCQQFEGWEGREAWHKEDEVHACLIFQKLTPKEVDEHDVIARKVFREQLAFNNKLLPILLRKEKYAGKWALVESGLLIGAFDINGEAYFEGLKRWPKGGFVVAPIEPVRPIGIY